MTETKTPEEILKEYKPDSESKYMGKHGYLYMPEIIQLMNQYGDQYKSAIQFAMDHKHLWDVENNVDTLYSEEDAGAIHKMEENFEKLLKL